MQPLKLTVRRKRSAVSQEPAAQLVAMRAWAPFHFNRDMREIWNPPESLLVMARRARIVGDQRYNRCEMARPDTPKMQVRNTVAVLFEPRGDPARQTWLRTDVNKNCTS